MNALEETPEILGSIIEYFAPTMLDRAEQVVAEKLNLVDGRASWSRRYVLSVANKTLAPSPRLARAVRALAASLDDVPVELARAEQVSVLAEPGDIRPGSLVMGTSRTCARPGCVVMFVPNHPSRKYCPVCSPSRRRG